MEIENRTQIKISLSDIELIIKKHLIDNGYKIDTLMHIYEPNGPDNIPEYTGIKIYTNINKTELKLKL